MSEIVITDANWHGHFIPVALTTQTTYKDLYKTVRGSFVKHMTPFRLVLNGNVLPDASIKFPTAGFDFLDYSLQIVHETIPIRISAVTISGRVVIPPMQSSHFFLQLSGRQLWDLLATQAPPDVVLKGITLHNLTDNVSLPVIQTDTVMYILVNNAIHFEFLVSGDEEDTGGSGGRKRGEKRRAGNSEKSRTALTHYK